MASAPDLAGGSVDLSKQAEYPIYLGDSLAGKASAKGDRFLNIQYNYRPTSLQEPRKSVIKASDFAEDVYRLSLADDGAPAASASEKTYDYRGSIVPSTVNTEKDKDAGYVLVFDSERKAFILEPVSAALNFNLTKAPGGKSKKQLLEEHPQLETLTDDEPLSGDDLESEDAELSAPDEGNPYDFRHFVQKAKTSVAKPNLGAEPSPSPTPDPYRGTPSRINASSTSAGAGSFIQKSKAQPKAKAIPRSAPKANTLAPPKRQARAAAKPKAPTTTKKGAAAPKSAAIVRSDDSESSSEDIPLKAKKDLKTRKEIQVEETPASQSPNIVVDGDLVIDMGDEPLRNTFDARYLQSDPEDDSADDADLSEVDNDFRKHKDADVEGLELPPPATSSAPKIRKLSQIGGIEETEDAEGDDIDDGYDPLAAEMEAAFDSAREDDDNEMQTPEAAYGYHSRPVDSDESEVSEEE